MRSIRSAASLALPFLLLATAVTAAPWARDLQASEPARLEHLERLLDGTFLAAGVLGSDLWLVRFDEQGRILRQDRLGSVDADRLSGLAASPLGGAALLGRWGAERLPFVVKLDAAGEIEWTTAFDSVAVTATLLDIAATADGGFVLSGARTGWPGWLVRLEADGSVAWERSFSGTLTGVGIAPDGDILVAIDGTPPTVARLDPTGTTTRWIEQFPGPSGRWCGFTAFEVLSDGGVAYFAACSGLGGAAGDSGLVRVSPSGRQLWSAYVSDDGEGWVQDVAERPDGSLVVPVVYLGSPERVALALSADGQPLWANQLTMGPTGLADLSTIAALPDGSLMALGDRALAHLPEEGWTGELPCLQAEPAFMGFAPIGPRSQEAIERTPETVETGLVSLGPVLIETFVTQVGSCSNCPGEIDSDQADSDADGVGDLCDSCPDEPNLDQADFDGDGAGDACDDCSDGDGDGFGDPGFPMNSCALDTCPTVFDLSNVDADGDGFGDACDACPDVVDDQTDFDRDGFGDACDNCPDLRNDQANGDSDSTGDACDNCPFLAGPQVDVDGDAVGDDCDVCPDLSDPRQRDADNDGWGDACDLCPQTFDGQLDSDGDGAGDACDNCAEPNPGQSDCDGDGVGQACQAGDDDGDGFPNGLDRCPCNYDESQGDRDGDGIGDACDPCPDLPDNGLDTDSDGVGDACDACPGDDDPMQGDRDSDGWGDSCDNCPDVPNADQADGDGNGVGDVCDSAPAPSELDLAPASPPLRVARPLSGELHLSWEDVGAERYDLYRGTLAALAGGRYDHGRFVCAIPVPEALVAEGESNRYYLVTGRRGVHESSYGRDSLGRERLPALTLCP